MQMSSCFRSGCFLALRKFGTVDDVAEVVAFLVSNGANYITGQTINVNGGLYMN